MGGGKDDNSGQESGADERRRCQRNNQPANKKEEEEAAARRMTADKRWERTRCPHTPPVHGSSCSRLWLWGLSLPLKGWENGMAGKLVSRTTTTGLRVVCTTSCSKIKKRVYDEREESLSRSLSSTCGGSSKLPVYAKCCGCVQHRVRNLLICVSGALIHQRVG